MKRSVQLLQKPVTGRMLSRASSTSAQALPRVFPRLVFSGIQPTGALHLGNYLGAIANWTKLQAQRSNNRDERILFSIVDLHALTIPQDPTELKANCRTMANALLACGIDPSKSVMFLQSHVAAHSELAWLLGCLAPMNELKSMTQFKDKSRKQAVTHLGLFAYPVLMAADVLLYRATHVPVGDDQVQHLELARSLAHHFNARYGTLFPPPQVMLTSTQRVMSLRDGKVKMSKSDASDLSRINLTDSEDDIVNKVRKAKTDSIEGLTADPARAEVANLLAIHSALSGKSVSELCATPEFGDMRVFKESLATVLVERLRPIRQEMARLSKDPGYMDRILTEGAREARSLAEETMKEVRPAIGLLS